jgi:hypothetical protein
MYNLIILILFTAITFIIGFTFSKYVNCNLDIYEVFISGLVILLVAGLILLSFNKFHFFNFAVFVILMISIFIWSISLYNKQFLENKACFLNINEIAFVVIILLVSIFTKLPITNFIFYIGDAGHYVNSANKMVLTGGGLGGFFPLNQVLLGMFSSLFGNKYTAFGTLFISLLIPWSIFLFIKTLFERKDVGFLVFNLVLFNILYIWFSKIPFSETLMLFMNVNILYFYLQFSKEEKERKKRVYMIFFVCFLTLASFTRITGLVWMIIITINYFFHLWLTRKDVNYQFLITILSFTGYLFSVLFSLKFSSDYYINWQIKSYLPFLGSIKTIIFFHSIWILIVILTYILFSNKNCSCLSNLYYSFKKHNIFYSLITYFGIILILSTLLSKGPNRIFYIAIFDYIFNNGIIPQDLYYLRNYFTYGSYFMFPLGYIIFFKQYNFLKNEDLSLIWFYNMFFLIIYYVRITYFNNHDVYLYWDRYFYSDVFLTFIIIIASALTLFRQKKIYNILLTVFFVAYFSTSAYWLHLNYNNEYLKNGFNVIEKIASSLENKEDSVVFLNDKYQDTWLFANFRHSILYPLKYSYNINVIDNAEYSSAFSRDAQLNLDKIKNFLNKNMDIYIVEVSDKKIETSYKFLTDKISIDIWLEKVDELSTQIDIKKHNWQNIFHNKIETFNLYVSIYKLNKMVILPEDFMHKEGFYSDNNWTNGAAVISDIYIPLNEKIKYLVLNTHGLCPINVENLNIELKVNGIKLQMIKKDNYSYFFELTEGIKIINSININSATFIPQILDINNDTRSLGIDVKSITFE